MKQQQEVQLAYTDWKRKLECSSNIIEVPFANTWNEYSSEKSQL